ncbi:GntR family transcriptional regulator [Bifidobacterium avesanii]|nr:GntR family transcriptional regulator [Bifidobacterium avesanii]KAB8292657.1 transcriptional regulator, GntR family [Bifidobacterium avesanii]
MARRPASGIVVGRAMRARGERCVRMDVERGEQTSKSDVAYAFLRRRIVFCEARPGDLLDEKAIAADLGCSRTPVREAIAKLAQEQLLTVYPRRGIVVSPISLTSMRDMLGARLVVEPACLHLAFDRLDRAALLTFRDDMTRRIAGGGERSDTIEDDFDFRFHMYFATVAGNRYFTDLMSRLMAQSQRIRFFSALAPDRILASYHEHLAIIDACLGGDERGAVEAVKRHLEATRDGYLAIARERREYFAE